MKYVVLHDMRFCRDEKTGSYRNGTHRKFAHRHVWESERGSIPEGWQVHHKDRDRGNNSIANLECMPFSERMSLHHAEEGWSLKQKRAIWFASIRPKAKDWHSSPEGREWHKQHALQVARDMVPKDFICLNCGNQFKTKPYGTVRYCTNACKSAARRASGVDNETRICTYCKDTFVVGRYQKQVTCSRACANRKRGSIATMKAAT